ncbi:receptor-interacting serine threonine- kinase 1-like protein [Labeo rohita]|uniref:Receptor-interacting serine threonine-kinase 1-like protein n=1 Tax=Labeo rohita TaxID=84645 RepID=A0A498MFI4_LABRO|nr:receptor-interacting serine threonine- kinase 1-like protein [Labeo rohita]RXN36603.1 receptor-interacting serine threonine- kinase 1-like protein [Labeo rohita]
MKSAGSKESNPSLLINTRDISPLGFSPKTEFSEEMFGDNAVVGSSPALANEHTNSSVRDAPDRVFWADTAAIKLESVEQHPYVISKRRTDTDRETCFSFKCCFIPELCMSE